MMYKTPVSVIFHSRTAGPRTFTFVGNVPKSVQTAIKSWDVGALKEFYGDYKKKLGGNDEIELTDADLDGSLNLATSVHASTTFIYDISLVHNNLMELKEKISVAIGIPLAFQHVYYLADGQCRSTYVMTVNQGVVSIDIRTIAESRSISTLVDAELYSNKNSIEIMAKDTFMLVTETTYHVYDMREFLPDVSHGDINVVYWGLICKYWPMFTYDAFSTYMNSPSSIHEIYPLLFPNNNDLLIKFAAESRIKLAVPDNLRVTITSAQLIVNGTQAINNLRDTFDALTTSAHVPEIRLYITHNDNKYLVKKYKESAGNFPNNTVKNEIVCLLHIPEPTFVSIAPDGSYVVATRWKETDLITFENILSKVKQPVNALITYINKVSGNMLADMTARTYTFHNVNLAIQWPLVINERAFKSFINSLTMYVDAEILQKKDVIMEHTYLFKKGMHSFRTDKINMFMISSMGIQITNQYMYLTNASVLSRWRQLYTGKTLAIVHRTSDVRFNINNVLESEYNIVREYISAAIASYMKTVIKSELVQKKSTKRLKKMQEEDPALFAFSKSRQVKDLYSRICQKPRQPVSYNEAEYKSLGKPSHVKEYWNFTTNAPMYYDCPSKEYPVLGFVGYDKHPKSYCLPCCNKGTTTSNEKRIAIETACMTNHVYEKGSLSIRHVVKFGKYLRPGKLSYLNPKVAKILSREDLRLIGKVPIGIAEFAIVGAICGALNITHESYIRAVTEYITPHTINFLQSGSLPKDVVTIINAIYTNKLHRIPPIAWVELFVELTLHVYNVRCFVINDTDVYTDEPAYVMEQNIVFTVVGQEYYPVIVDGVTIFAANDYVSILYDICSQAVEGLTYDKVLHQSKLLGFDVIGKLVNRSGNTYGLVVQKTTEHCIIGIEYSRSTAHPIVSALDYIENTKMSVLVALLGQIGIDVEYALFAGTTFCGVQDVYGINHYARIYDGELPAKQIMYDYLLVNDAIVKAVQPKPALPLVHVGMSLYKTYQYRLFVSEFFAYISTSRNVDVRRVINDAIVAGDVSLVNELLKDFNDDRIRIQNVIRQLKTEGMPLADVTRWFDGNRFDFDDILINKLIDLPEPEASLLLLKSAEHFVLVGQPPEDMLFPNTYTACTYNSSSAYCAENKLLVESVESLANLLLHDLRDPLMLRYLKSKKYQNVINYLEFQPRDDIIEIYDLGISI